MKSPLEDDRTWLDELSPEEFEEFERRLKWVAHDARSEQITPPGDWKTWLVLAGRGWGKTRTAAEDIAAYGLDHPKSRIAVVAETFSDGRDTCIEGESGLFGVLPESSISHWNRSLGELVLTNGTRYKIYSGDKPGQLRGPQHSRAWVDELCKFRHAAETWTQLQLGLRLGRDPRAIVTTTPKPMALLKDLMTRDNTYVTRGSTYDNAANLSETFLDEVRRRYEGTRTGQQELLGVYLEEVEGALWTRRMIEDSKISEARLPEMQRVVVGVDPAITATDESDLTGLTVCGLGMDGRSYILYSTGVRLSPDGWARRAVNLYHEYEADRIVAEKNQGGDMVGAVIGTADSRVPVKLVHASRGKRTRAEPVAALFEQGRIGMLQSEDHTLLEDQLCQFTGAPGEESPDLLDSLVWSVTELMLTHTAAPRVRVLSF